MRDGSGGRSFEDRLATLVRDVVDDIRQKVVEEPWFGRPVTEKLSDIHQCLDQGVGRDRGQEADRFYGRDAPDAKEPEHDHVIER